MPPNSSTPTSLSSCPPTNTSTSPHRDTTTILTPTFPRHPSLLQQRKHFLDSEQRGIEVAEKKLAAAKRNIEIQKMQIASETEKAKYELGRLEGVLEKVLGEMIRLAEGYLDVGEREVWGMEVERKIRGCVGGVGVKRARVCREGGGMEKVRRGSEGQLVSPPTTPLPHVGSGIPEKRTASCAGFRQAYVESDDDDGS